jgi:hypothetical protein
MAIAIKEDTVQGGALEEDELGATAIRRFHVSGIVSAGQAGYAAFYGAVRNAVDATTNRGLPKLGDPHPQLVGYFTSRIRIEPTPSGSATQAIVYAHYKSVPYERALLDVAVNGVTMASTTEYDKDGNILWVAYNPSLGNAAVEPPKPTDGIGQGWNYSYIRAPVLLPDTTLEIVMREPPKNVPWPGDYVRRVNKNFWNGGEPGEWLCVAITTSMMDIGSRTRWKDFAPEPLFGSDDFAWPYTRWRVSYVFRYSRRPVKVGERVDGGPGHKPIALFVHNQTGVTPHGIDPKVGNWPTASRGNGWSVSDVYQPANFDALDLPMIWK